MGVFLWSPTSQQSSEIFGSGGLAGIGNSSPEIVVESPAGSTVATPFGTSFERHRYFLSQMQTKRSEP